MDERLEQAKTPYGGARFYPPGQHPAVYRERWALRQLQILGLGNSETAEYHKQRIADFEAAESEAKAHYLGYFRGS